MNEKTQKILIISVFVLVWIGIAYYSFTKFNSAQDEFELYFFENQETQPIEKTVTEKIYLQEIGNIDPVDNGLIDFQEKDPNLQLDGNIVTAKNEDINFFEEIIPEKCGTFPCYSPEKFLEIYTSFENNSGMEKIITPIYDNIVADKYIRKIAENRGYRQRIFADELEIVDFESIRTRPQVRDAYIAMREAMKKEDITIHFVSGYRTAGDQLTIFKNKMGPIVVGDIIKGVYDEKIMQVLNISALPGYSKHHFGYTADFGCGSDYLVYDFATTSCYTWMSENNFENAKRFGFLPSYPNAIIDQGPNPEPWEYVWVGVENIL